MTGKKSRRKKKPEWLKCDSLGNNILQNAKLREEEKQSHESVIEATRTHVAERDPFDLAREEFVLVHCNPMLKIGPDDWLPAEVALVRCSVRNGISAVYHTFANSDIPPGYAMLAEDCSRKHSKLLTDSKPLQMSHSSDWKQIADKLELFLVGRTDDDGGGPYPPMYAMEDDKAATRSMVEKLLVWGGGSRNSSSSVVKVRYLNHLLYLMSDRLLGEQSKYVRSIGPEAAASDLKYGAREHAHRHGLACKWHDHQGEAPHCSLFQVRSWAFTMSRHFSQALGFQLREGLHLPRKPTLYEYEEKAPAADEGILEIFTYPPNFMSGGVVDEDYDDRYNDGDDCAGDVATNCQDEAESADGFITLSDVLSEIQNFTGDGVAGGVRPAEEDDEEFPALPERRAPAPLQAGRGKVAIIRNKKSH